MQLILNTNNDECCVLLCIRVASPQHCFSGWELGSVLQLVLDNLYGEIYALQCQDAEVFDARLDAVFAD